MNRRTCAVSTLVLVFAVWAVGARGQTGGGTVVPAGGAAAAGGAGGAAAPGAAKPTTIPAVQAPVSIPAEVYSAPGKNVATIADFAKKNIINLLNDTNPPVQQAARNNLEFATMTSGALASPEFLFQYGKALNDEFLPKLSAKGASLRQRLNIGIVVAKTVPVLDNLTLMPTTINLIKDDSEAVMLWGLKAAPKQVQKALEMRNPAAPNQVPPLVAAIAPAVLKHPSGAVFAEAYEALSAPDEAVFVELRKLWGYRLSQYQSSTIPDDADVDGRPVYILTTATMWKTVINDKKKQNRVMQMVSDQIAVAAQWADKTKGDKHDNLVGLVVQCAGAIVVVGKNTQNPELVATASDLANVKVETFPADQQLWSKVKPIIAAIQKAYPDVKEPPTVGNSEGTGTATGPVVGPASGGGPGSVAQ